MGIGLDGLIKPIGITPVQSPAVLVPLESVCQPLARKRGEHWLRKLRELLCNSPGLRQGPTIILKGALRPFFFWDIKLQVQDVFTAY